MGHPVDHVIIIFNQFCLRDQHSRDRSSASNGLSCSDNIEENGIISPVTKDTVDRNESIKLQTCKF